MSKSYTRSFFLLTSLFFTWGLLTVLVDFLIPRLKEIFELSYFQAGFVQFAFFLAYLVFSIPSGILLRRIGYKKGIMLGLVVMGVGCLLFLPAASFRVFPLFLLGYFTLASGMTVLQVAANPYITVLGDQRTASSRLNLAQAFNSLGTTIAPILGTVLILSDKIYSSEEIKLMDNTAKELYFSSEASAVQTPFLVLSICLLFLALIVLKAKLPQILSSEINSNFIDALKNRKLQLGTFGIFLYVGAEVAIGSYLVNYFLDMQMVDIIKETPFMNFLAALFNSADLNVVDGKAVVGAFVFYYWGGAMIGRFVGSYFTKVFSPNKVLSVFAFLAILFIAISMNTMGLVAMWSIIAVGLFNSIMFPTIFSIAIEDLGELKPQGSGILCTAICGGAIIPPLYGYLVDVSGFKIAFVLLIACYAYILIFGRITRRMKIA